MYVCTRVNIHEHTSNVIQHSNKNIKISLERCGNAYFFGGKYLHPLRERYCISENAQIVYVPMKNYVFFILNIVIETYFIARSGVSNGSGASRICVSVFSKTWENCFGSDVLDFSGVEACDVCK